MISVKVPATSANIGPGFDCMGVALQIYNTIDVEEIPSGLEINILDATGDFLPKNEKNLVYQSMLAVFDKTGYYPKGLKINLKNNIPVTRGLGSSSACVAGGLFAANALTGNKLTKEEIILMAAQIEGHPDNSTPAILGGMVVAVLDKSDIRYVRIELPDHLKFAVFVPNFPLPTKKARDILPGYIPHKDGVYNTGRAALMAASLITGNYDNITFAIEDRLHQPYREGLIPGMKEIFQLSRQYGAKGVFLSGAGPTLIAILDQDYEHFRSKMGMHLQQHMQDWTVDIVSPDNEGIKIEIEV
ncbi:MAG: homoserine kinase [Petroclostridium sp.]|jgi:homoserine kinase|uniref:homoserine kinase n=1 Tax=Petroclostridium xylanilyticum TaxID=1792311 RepID=UPI000B97FEEF|nr:homoserine kinase [Petroclostridium xylanilyticum]MBZ4647177.1 homoserine kinase [Clostridia bacterium]MDK2810460.1 homoserine kinase [Petroclostridium sp.]